MRSALLLALFLTGCASDARLLAENADLRIKLHATEEQLRQQQDYVAATQDRDSQIQTESLQIFNQTVNDWNDAVDDIREEIKEEERGKCKI